MGCLSYVSHSPEGAAWPLGSGWRDWLVGERLAAWTWEGMSRVGAGGGPDTRLARRHGLVTRTEGLSLLPGAAKGVWEGF